MRIVQGRHAGRDLTSPGGRVRPTAESVRVAWLDWVEELIPDARILELCAGTGAVGLEALSRGAATVDFVERHPAALHSLKANVKALRETDRTRVFKRDAVPFTRRLEAGAYDLVLADPPYGSRLAALLLDIWKEQRYAPVFVLEHATDHDVPKGARSRRLGDTTITRYHVGVD
ncbi:MAG TPA: RsmD family RNA methyltransferase [Longimicrobiales bacterium]|nr:RsmD family RNA methyltransferase [Longimicrobiales bacterium]